MTRAMPTRTWFGQPAGLTVLFLTEMWEKFSYFGMRALLVYYMTKQLLFAQQHASMIYGVYTALAYFTPVLGGMLADRVLGRRRAVITGGVIMAAGHFMMSFPTLLFPALAAIALGNGLFLPTLPSQVGDLYPKGDPRRGSAFNVYYVGVNLGAFLAPLVCGTLGELYGWHVGFAAAGVGMLAGLVVYVLGRAYLPPEPPLARGARPPWSQLLAPGHRAVVGLLVGIAAVIVVFRGAYEQIGNTVALWLDQGVDRSMAAGFTVPMTWFFSLNPLLVFLITPFLVRAWNRRARAGHEDDALGRMAIGAAVVALAFVVVAVVGGTAAAPAAIGWAVLFFALFTLGELFILPVGLGLFARLAPPGFAATLLALWFLASFGGNLLAGALGMAWSTLGVQVFFGVAGAICLLTAGLLLALRIPAQRVLGAGENRPADAGINKYHSNVVD